MKRLLTLGCLLAASSSFSLAQTGNVGIGTMAPQSKLHVNGGVRMDTLAGSSNRVVFADAQGRVFAAQSPAPFTNATAYPITLNGCASNTGAVSTITVAGLPTAVPSAGIKVRVNIAHNFDDDVRAYLQAPNGAVLNLLLLNGNGGQNFTNTIFWDGAAGTVPPSNASAPFTGTYKPTGNMNASCGITPTVATFGGIGGGSIVPNGVWTLRVFDDFPIDDGTLNNWSISFDGTDPSIEGTFPANALLKGSGGSVVSSSVTETGGNVGIGVTAPHAPLHFSSTATSRKIVLFETQNNDHQFYGFGINSATLRYQTDAAGADHVFFSAAGPSASTELMRIKGDGNVGIGTSTVNARLDVAGTTETDALRITASGGGTKDFAIKSDAAGNVGFRKGFGGVGMRYIICTAGCFPSTTTNICQNQDILGEVKLFAGVLIPAGWADCNGALLPIGPNSALFNLLGTLYGGDGVNSFALPDLRGAVPVGTGANATNNWSIGEKN